MHNLIEYLLIFIFSFSAAYSKLPVPTPTPVPTIQPTSTPRPTPKLIQGTPSTGLTQGLVRTSVGSFSATILSLDITRTKMVTDTAADNDCAHNCPTLSLKDFVSKNNGIAGVNGTYFCPATYPDCASKTNSFDFPVYLTRLNKWINSYALSWGERRAIVYQDGSGVHYQHNSAGFSGGVNAAIINYPGLLDGGNIQIDSHQSGLSAKQQAKNTKLSLCVVNPQRLLAVVGTGVTMLEFAHLNQALGCQGALNLDTGGSLSMVYNGRYIYQPGRSLPNAVIFVNR